MQSQAWVDILQGLQELTALTTQPVAIQSPSPWLTLHPPSFQGLGLGPN